ncbi:type VI secretion system baseplate subunit TssF, partial [Yersinia pestis]|nr:type VI secretion system baseplate subunit TssF [Yersinia pestis]MBE7794946.1 type VI secretion system baseplate subunit TssF [Yersinia pestis]MBE7799072.1 type VI secretion system baseplate subunit TssF [Yersinia pestis]
WPFLKGNVEPPLGGLKKGVSLNRTSRSWIKRSKIWGSVH